VPFYRKPLRLPAAHYLGRRIYFVTMGTENRAAFFADHSTGHWALEQLLAIAANYDFTLHAYCAMPDHLHFLSEGLSNTCDWVKFVNTFKERTAYQFRKTHGNRLWQMRYYDHILRPKEALEDPACYIWWNPVRKGLCDTPNLYPLSGSQTIDWMKRSSATTRWTPPWKL
jgi:putative transposase